MESRGSAVPFSIRLRKGLPISTIIANRCLVIFERLRNRVTLRPRAADVIASSSRGSCCSAGICVVLIAIEESLAALEANHVTVKIRFGEILGNVGLLCVLYPKGMPILWLFSHQC